MKQDMQKNKYGKVYIAGAGPGDAGLITVKAMECLRNCDVIFFDRLANTELLMEARDDSEKIFVGKEAGHHYVSQEKTIELLIEKAKEGKKVLRLKGGDPLIFGRGAEEAIALRNEDIEFEFIPGITAGAAAATYAGIPFTHRNMVTQSVFITAHESPDKPESQVEWKHLAKMKNTNLIIYMGVSALPQIVKTLIKYGMDKNIPAALIENGTLPIQRTITSELRRIPKKMLANNIKPPVIFFIGPTVAFHEKLKWFENKPLFGKRIVTTRAKDQTASISKKLSELGASVIPYNVIKTQYSESITNIRDLLISKKFDWIIFSSENGVRYFFRELEAQGSDSRVLSGVKIGVIGTGTAAKLKIYSLLPDFIPSKFTSLSFVEELPLKYDLKNKKVLRIKGNFKNDFLTDSLRDIGVNVSTLEVYKLSGVKPDDTIIKDLINNGADAFMFTSISTVNNFFDTIGGENAPRLLADSNVVAIGPVTASALKEKKVENIIESEIQTIDGMLATLINIFKK
ncbi:uroporphyrinogen-III C-methyltransferase [Bacteroidota bacterium]